jgi:hypothetical protein
MINILFQFFRSVFCSHKFDIKDMEQTGIPYPQEPDNDDFKAWRQYHEEIYTCDAYLKRIKWPCCKCHKVFYAHCGLDILRHGKIKNQAVSK